MKLATTQSIISFINAMLLALIFMPTTGLAAGGTVSSPTGTAPDRFVYYPATEALSKNEIRIACGTGLPAERRDQAATCWC